MKKGVSKEKVMFDEAFKRFWDKRGRKMLTYKEKNDQMYKARNKK